MSIIEQETLHIETGFDNGVNMIYEDHILTNPQVLHDLEIKIKMLDFYSGTGRKDKNLFAMKQTAKHLLHLLENIYSEINNEKKHKCFWNKISYHEKTK